MWHVGAARHKFARDAAVELAGRQDKVAKLRAKLKQLWEGADATWFKCTAAEGTTYQDSLVDLLNSDLRTNSKYFFRRLYTKVGA